MMDERCRKKNKYSLINAIGSDVLLLLQRAEQKTEGFKMLQNTIQWD